ncbi:MAG TPA: sugar-binding protein, partial [Ignavibacteriaceae bacterium]|nr:sugar-binding protein [Ignavibacteriaceae bacterium]
MKTKTALLFVLCMFLLPAISSAQNKLGKIINNWKYEIPKTTVAPVIDGLQDPVWKTLDWNFLTSYDNNGTGWTDWIDLFGATKAMYDDNNLYLLFWTQDDDPVGNDAAVANWQRNAVEAYFDGDYSRDMSGTVSFPDHHLTFRHEHIGDEANSDWDVETGLDSTGLEWKFFTDTTTMTGYWFELKVPLESIDMPNTPNSQIGVEFQQDDNDGSGRDAVSKWWADDGDSAWQYAGTWGTGVLSDRVADTKLLIMKVPDGSAPVVDGVLDDIYLAGTSATTNNFGNISITSPVYPDDFSDAFFRCYLLYDDNNIYGFFDVFDDDQVGNDAAVANWQRNAVELYLDGDNSKDCSGTV